MLSIAKRLHGADKISNNRGLARPATFLDSFPDALPYRHDVRRTHTYVHRIVQVLLLDVAHKGLHLLVESFQSIQEHSVFRYDPSSTIYSMVGCRDGIGNHSSLTWCHTLGYMDSTTNVGDTVRCIELVIRDARTLCSCVQLSEIRAAFFTVLYCAPHPGTAGSAMASPILKPADEGTSGPSP